MGSRHALRLFRYGAVGAVATASHYALLLMLVETFDVDAPLAAAAGAVCGTLVAYGGNRRLTFAASVPHRVALPRFATIAGSAAVVSAGFVWFGTVRLGWNYLASQLAATLLMLIVGYHLNRIWTFRHG